MGNFILRGVLPTLLAVTLFISSIFLLFIPSLEENIMVHKREMIRELTTSAWNILAKFENDEKTGVSTRQEAQNAAITQIRNLHYGSQMKDYFWINDFQPKMVIHPYRPDLNGKDLNNFVDSHGKKLFVEMVEVVKKQGAGFVTYRWQWKDDPSRIVPKLSYVKGFEPWGWVIGTGIYIDDVEQEIRNVTQQLLLVSLLILTVVSALLAFILWGSWRAETLRKNSEDALKTSEERYRLLVESAGDCIIMSLTGEGLFANQSMLRLLGYSHAEFAQLQLDDVVVPTRDEMQQGYANYQGLLQGRDIPQHYESSLKDSEGNLHRVMLSLSLIPLSNKQGFSLIASHLTSRHERELNRTLLLDELQHSLMFFHNSVANLKLLEPITLSPEATIDEISEKIITAPQSILLVTVDNHPLGIIGLQELLPGFVAKDDCSIQTAEHLLFSTARIQDTILLFDAYLLMEKQNFRPLIVLDKNMDIKGLLTYSQLLQIQSYSPTLLFREIQEAKTEEELTRVAKKGPELVCVMVKNGARTQHVNHFISTTADLVLQRGLQLVLSQMAPPPVPFAFLVTGSEGRQEQTLCTDQDNGIIFADVPTEEFAETQKYFLDLGLRICTLLDSAGYSFCKGKIMAKESRWCQPLSTWKKYFSRWVTKLEPKDLLETKIFFDFRCAYGDKELVRQLSDNLNNLLPNNPRFFVLLAMDVLQFEPPLGMFGNFIMESTGGYEDTISIKAVMVRIVDFARIYALKHGITEQGTFARLQALLDKGILTVQSHQEMTQAYGYMMRLRIEHQVKLREEGYEADNFIRPNELSAIDQKMLKEIFSQIKHFQMRLSGDFTGASDRL